MEPRVVFIQGGGAGAHDEDALLAASLQRELGPGILVDYPLMPDEDEPDLERWQPVIAGAIGEGVPVILVGHSIGGYLLLQHLAERHTDAIAVCIIAAPFPGGDAEWTFDDFDVPSGLGRALPNEVFL